MIEKFNKIHNRTIKSVEPAALDALRIYQWPGNIRELENVIEHAFILQSGDVIQLSSLPSHIHHLPGEAKSVENPLSGESLNLSGDYDGLETSVLNYPALKERFEREFIIRALKTFNGRINRTAEHTMMTKMTLLRKLERYGIDPKDFQNH
jgi:DNA-binding NtrC family response regulator